MYAVYVYAFLLKHFFQHIYDRNVTGVTRLWAPQLSPTASPKIF